MTKHVTPAAATASKSEVTHELIVVYVGTSGTNMDTSYQRLIRRMKDSVRLQNTTTGRAVIMRGVSLDPLVDDGIRELSHLGPFDEISVGGNWTNSAVVKYLGPDIGQSRHSAIPQVIVLERDVVQNSAGSLQITPEREVGRFIYMGEIMRWIRSGTPNPR